MPSLFLIVSMFCAPTQLYFTTSVAYYSGEPVCLSVVVEKTREEKRAKQEPTPPPVRTQLYFITSVAYYSVWSGYVAHFSRQQQLWRIESLTRKLSSPASIVCFFRLQHPKLRNRIFRADTAVAGTDNLQWCGLARSLLD
ncbi:hypothetical protein RRG08_019214 [Elysia crispata]|uniref:Secreted protein n=1 Tax=Elysia crispata TaxID=231223 RepID=A0AAE1AUM4_9GAST|nr:hypothetical protein RRG08_019214 [Elysia crispata]